MTITEFAQLAGVSVSTVSKVMNHKDTGIRAETRERILQLAKEYNYKPYASVLPQASTRTLGVVFRDASDINMTASGILAAASREGYSVIFRESADCTDLEFKNISALLGMHIDGLIWEPVSAESRRSLAQIEQAQIPFLLIGGFASASDSDADSPYPLSKSELPMLDFFQMGYFITEALVQKGHRQIACLLSRGSRTSQFYEGYLRCLFDHQIPFDETLIFQNEDQLPVSKIVSHAFSGIVVSHYAAAMKFYEVIAALHYAVPDDFSIVSLKDDARLQSDYPPLSTLTVAHRAYGENLAYCLLSMIEKKKQGSFSPLPLKLDHQRTIDLPYHSRRKKIIVIGSVNIDNYMNVEALPHTGKTVTAPNVSVYPGGKCLNEAIGVAQLGHSVSMIGRVGNDADADLIFAALKKLQIDTTGLHRSHGTRTGQAYVFVQQNGDSMISLMTGANNLVTKQDILDSERSFPNTGYCLLQTEIPMETAVFAAQLAKKHQLTTVVKPSACTVFPEELLRCTDLLVPNADELNEICALLCPECSSMEEKAEWFLKQGVKTIIVTLGAHGCYLREAHTEVRIPAADFVSTDSTGACDAFISALVSYLMDGYDMLQAVQIATYAAGFSTTRQGVSSALIDKNSLEAYIQRVAPSLLILPEKPLIPAAADAD